MTENLVRNRRLGESKEISPFADDQAEREAVLGITAEVDSRMRKIRDEMIDPRNTLNFRHGRTWSGPEVENADVDGEFTEHSHLSETKFEDVLTGDLGLLEKEISSIAEGMNRSFSETLFHKMNDVTEKTGNIVHGGDARSFPDVLIEMYEKIKLGVDRDGRISLPKMFPVPPSKQEKLQSELAAMDDATCKRLKEVIGQRAREASDEEQARCEKFESAPDAES